jgi:hypothetical protein
MSDKLTFTPHILEQITKTLVSLHDLLSDVTTRSDLMAQELIEQQHRIEQLENRTKGKGSW